MVPSRTAFVTGEFNGSVFAPPNFGWLGRGYNLLKTDPLNFARKDGDIISDQPLFKFYFEDADGYASQNESKAVYGVAQTPGGTAECDSSHTLVKSYEDLQDFSKQDYSANVGVGKFAFSASRAHSEINDDSTGRDRAFIMERCDVHLHTLQLKLRWRKGEDYLRQPLEEGFREAIEEMPLEWSADNSVALKNILDRFGTHFAERIEYGGTAYAKTEITKTTYQMMSATEDGYSIGAEGQVKAVSFGGSFSDQSKESSDRRNNHENSTDTRWWVGSTGNTDTDAWEASVKDNPMPVAVEFRPVFDLLTPVFFPDDPDIGLKKHLLEYATGIYFRQYGHTSMTHDDPRALDIPEPRSLCVRLESLDLEIDGSVAFFGGALRGGFTDGAGTPVRSIPPFSLAMDQKVDSRHRPDGLVAWDRTFVLDGNTLPLYTSCTGTISERFIRDGKVYLHGELHTHDVNRKRLSRDFPEQAFPLGRIEPGVVQAFDGSITLPGATARYRLQIWEEGTARP